MASAWPFATSCFASRWEVVAILAAERPRTRRLAVLGQEGHEYTGRRPVPAQWSMT